MKNKRVNDFASTFLAHIRISYTSFGQLNGVVVTWRTEYFIRASSAEHMVSHDAPLAIGYYQCPFSEVARIMIKIPPSDIM
jgi:hypothetical protein